MISYWKTQWWRILCAAMCFGAALYFAFQPAPDTTTTEGINQVIGYLSSSIGWLISAVFWFLMSFIYHNEDRIKLLEKKAEKYDAMHELVQELYKANEVDRKIDAQQERRIRLLEDKLR